ncbi:MAG: thrombospondin type 3 repeat-containing protein [Candidatus Paceibacterota bacterium]
MSSSESLVADKIDTKKAFEKDSDNDGLKDWEEVLYGTKPNDPDTKGQGLGDLKEVEKIRASSTITVDTFANSSSTTATDRFSRELFTRYLEAKRAGQDITPELSDAIANDLTSKSYDVEMPAFDATTIKTVNTSDLSFIRTYGNDLATIATTPMPDGVPNELFIIEEITTQQSTSDQNSADLSELIDRYTRMHEKLIKMKVPADIKSAHAQFVQGLEILRDAVIGAKSLDTDPVGALPKIAQYEDGATIIGASSLRFKQYFATKGILFSSNEPGFIFTK